MADSNNVSKRNSKEKRDISIRNAESVATWRLPSHMEGCATYTHVATPQRHATRHTTRYATRHTTRQATRHATSQHATPQTTKKPRTTPHTALKTPGHTPRTRRKPRYANHSATLHAKRHTAHQA